MTPVSGLKLMLAASGLIIWGYGIRSDQPIVQWVGIAMLAAAVVLRFTGRRKIDR